MRKTKIVVTVGPACQSPEAMEKMIRGGADLFRINASHTNTEQLKEWIKRIQTACVAANERIPILVDLQGPRIRTGSLQNCSPVKLTPEKEVIIQVSNKPGTEKVISTSCKQFPQMVKKGDPILIDNGMLELKVLSVSKNEIRCRIIIGGLLGENKGINLPKAPSALPALSAKDRKDLLMAISQNVDYLALSFVRTAKDILQIKKILKRQKKNIPIIAKIEKPQAIDHLDSILETADGIMVARGDLGIELGVEKVPLIQKDIIRRTNNKGLPVIIATHMLESMITNATPTRAEASDIANSVLDQTDAVMLSGETAVGAYPLKTLKTMSKIIREVEHFSQIKGTASQQIPLEYDIYSFIHVITKAARQAVNSLKAKAVVVLTRTGRTAALVSKFSPNAPVIALVPDYSVYRRIAIFKGVKPVKIKYSKKSIELLPQMDKILKKLKMFKKGDSVVLVSGKNAFSDMDYFIKIHRCCN